MWRSAALLGALCLLLRPPVAAAVELWAYKATVKVPLQSAATVDDRDVIQTVRLGSKQLLNAALGQPLTRKVPKNLILVVLIPTSRMAAGSHLAIFDRDTGQVRTVIASLLDARVLQSDTGRREAVGVGEAQVQPLPLGGISGEAQLLISPFSSSATPKAASPTTGSRRG